MLLPLHPLRRKLWKEKGPRQLSGMTYIRIQRFQPPLPPPPRNERQCLDDVSPSGNVFMIATAGPTTMPRVGSWTTTSAETILMEVSLTMRMNTFTPMKTKMTRYLTLLGSSLTTSRKCSRKQRLPSRKLCSTSEMTFLSDLPCRPATAKNFTTNFPPKWPLRMEPEQHRRGMRRTSINR
ncbi:hypothetical protein BDD12DRAFT_847429 [Trichophaea hybrida]|nr:hypothetical protein BDD12DRAFT_847429 [Trichophaea hybrida]